MADITRERRRAALWTIGRGSRSLLRYSIDDASFVIAGTNTALGGNKIHVLREDKERNIFVPIRVYETDAEVWSIELVDVHENSVTVIAVTRRKRRSCVEIWSLLIGDEPSVSPTQRLLETGVDENVHPIDLKGSIALEGNGTKIKRHGTHGRLYLVLTGSTATILRVGDALDTDVCASLNVSPLLDESEESMIVDGGWIADQHVFVASISAVAIFDSTTATLEALLDLKKVNKKSDDSDDLWVPSFISRITSACFVESNMLYVGGQDGSLRAYELVAAGDPKNIEEREKEEWQLLDDGDSKGGLTKWMLRNCWEATKGHNQWVSVLHPLPNGGVLSGDIDGVVHCWTKDGSSAGTFPQHVDTVTSATASAQSFITISYDGRIALNQIPIGA